MAIESSELILNPDGSIYHLNLCPGDIAETIITVGDQDRVAQVSKFFDKIELKKHKREFTCHTGYVGNKRISVISTGIGCDNIDIVFNEIDALFNIDFGTREIKKNFTSLEFYRIGTSGCIQEDIPLDSFLVTQTAVGMDNLGTIYGIPFGWNDAILDQILNKTFNEQLQFYTIKCENSIINKFSKRSDFLVGNTLTATGFYGPQGRTLRALTILNDFMDTFSNIKWNGNRMTNIEMETSAMYLFSSILGHKAISINALVANRKLGKFSKNPKSVVESLIEKSLEIIVE